MFKKWNKTINLVLIYRRDAINQTYNFMKPGSYTKIYIQIVMAVKYKERGLSKEFRDEVFRIMGGILNEKGHKPIIINGVNDHVHLFLGMNPKYALSDTVKEIKRRASIFINEKGYYQGKFYWQHGYGAFSYSQSHIQRVYDYIANQEQHHAKNSFKKEYIQYLKSFEVDYDEQFLFKF